MKDTCFHGIGPDGDCEMCRDIITAIRPSDRSPSPSPDASLLEARSLVARLAAAESRAERAEAAVAELDAEVKRLKGLLDRDRTGLASALSRIDREVSGRMWVADSRGCYEWDDDAYKAEAGDALRTVQAIATEALRESGTVANEGFFPRLTVELDTEREMVKALTAEVAYLRAWKAWAGGMAHRLLAANPEPQPPEGCEP